MEKELIYSLKLSQSEIEYLIQVLDTIVKSHGLQVAEKCANLHRKLVDTAEPIQEPKEEPVEEVSLEEVEDELEQIMEVPKKRKRSSKNKK